MGQYYHPIILKNDKKTIVGYVHAHKLGQGLKLMEHSYIDNPMVNVVENYLKDHAGARVVWAGDYADPEPTKIPKEQAKAMWQGLVANGQVTCGFETFWKTDKRVYKVDKDGDFVGENLYELSSEKYGDNDKIIRRAKPEIVASAENTQIRWIINDDRKEYVDLWNVPCVDGYRIHPLPLLTCEGNGRGGGDYHGTSLNMVGLWARNFIRVHEHDWQFASSLPNLGYKEITPNFVEGYSIKSELSHLAKYTQLALENLDYSSDPHFVGEIRKAANEILAMLPKVSAEEKRVMAAYTK